MSVVTFHDDGLSRFLSSEFKKKFPVAVNNALNSTGFEFRKDAISQMRRELTLNRPFLKQQFQVKKSTTSTLKVQIGWTNLVWFSDLVTEGGTRTPKSGGMLAVPVGTKRTGGVIPKSRKPAAVLRRKGSFIREHNGKKYIYFTLPNGRISVAYVLVPKTTYNEPQKYFKFNKLVDKYSNNNKFVDKLITNLNRM